MSLGDRLLGGPRTVVLLEERFRTLDGMARSMKSKLEGGLADHERRLVRLETIVEIARAGGVLLRIAKPGPATD